jgi:hypothetical protein
MNGNWPDGLVHQKKKKKRQSGPKVRQPKDSDLYLSVDLYNGITALWLVHWTRRISFRAIFVNLINNKGISKEFNLHFTKQLTDFWSILYYLDH